MKDGPPCYAPSFRLQSVGAMEGICGLFSSSLAAAWVQAIFTGGAAAIAVFLYAQGRRDAKKDREDQRAVLDAMMAPYLESAYSTIRTLIASDAITQPCTREEWQQQSHILNVQATSRLRQLQGRLVGIGRRQDGEIAGFIESLAVLEERRVELDERAAKGGHELVWKIAVAMYLSQLGECMERGKSLAMRGVIKFNDVFGLEEIANK